MSNFTPQSLRSVLVSEKTNNGASFTALSKKTNKDYTFKISRHTYKGKWYTTVYVEQGYMNFVKIGGYFKGKIYEDRKVVESTAAKAIAWILSKVDEEKFTDISDNVELSHLGCCILCGKTLTDAKSISFGLGPTCRNR
jgi:hypothetical protein